MTAKTFPKTKNAEGVYSNDITKELNKLGQSRMKFTIDVNDAWREAKTKDPSLEFRMTFLQFKKGYSKKKRCVK